MTPREIQHLLTTVAIEIGESTDATFKRKYLRDWPEEEHVTPALFEQVVTFISLQAKQKDWREVELTASFIKRRAENVNGADVMIRFRCTHPYWQIDTRLLIQAKRQEPGKPLKSSDHTRLIMQTQKMLSFTSECFVAIYSLEQGVCLVPAVSAGALGGSHDLFDLSVITWPTFLAGIFTGHYGDTVASRLPPFDSDIAPSYELLFEVTEAHKKPQLRSLAS